MVLLRVIGKDEVTIHEIAQLLLREELVLDVNIKEGVKRAELRNGKYLTTTVHLMTAKTKGLLFPAIDKLLVEKYGDKMPELYSLPIVNMDWDQVHQLTDQLRQI